MVEVAMKHGKQHTFTIIDDRILHEQRYKSNTILRLFAACALRALQACPTHFYEYPIKIDNIGPIRWHITPSEWNQQDFDIGIGAPSDEIDISGLSAAEKTQLFGAVIEDEDIYDLESKVSQALKSEFKEIMRKIKS